MLQCGVSEVNITPPLGTEIPGYFHTRIATGIKDELYAKAMVLDDGERIVAFIALDSICIEKVQVEEIRKRVFETTGVIEKNIMVSAIHTHTGPPIINIYGSRKNNDYIRWLIKKAADAVVLAYRRMEPVRIGYGVGQEADIAFNRRFYMKDGTTRTNPGVGSCDIVKAAAPVDSDVIVMRIDRMNGEPLGVVTNYTCHLDVVGGTEFCADYPGELSKVIKMALGENVVSLFFTGACGDINHIDVTGKMKINIEHYKKMGRILAGEVIKVREKIETSEDATLGCVSKVVSIKRRIPSPEMVDAARNLIEKENRGADETILAREIFSRSRALSNICYGAEEVILARDILELSAMQKETEDVEFQVIRVGEMAVTALSGEIFVEIGLNIKKSSKFKYNMICELANGSAGYVATKKTHSEGGYEIMLSKYTNLVPEAEDVFTVTAVELLDSVK